METGTRKKAILLQIVRSAIILGCYSSLSAHAKTCDLYFSDSIVINSIELASTDNERHLGLSNREPNQIGNGMLFKWDDIKPRVIWMKDTSVPLIAIFFNSSNAVEKIESMEPNSTKLHVSNTSSGIALEVKTGLTDRLHIGQKLNNVVCK